MPSSHERLREEESVESGPASAKRQKVKCPRTTISERRWRPRRTQTCSFTTSSTSTISTTTTTTTTMTTNTSAFSALSPELKGTIATYLDIIGQDLLHYCIVVGPDVSSVVRNSVLRDNDDYLRYCVSLGESLDDEDGRSHSHPSSAGDSNEQRPRDVSGTTTVAVPIASRKEKILNWMEINDWRDRCMRTKALDGTGLHSEIRTNRETVGHIRFKRTLGGLLAFAGWSEELEEQLRVSNVSSLVGKGDTLVEVNGISIRRGASADDVFGSILGGDGTSDDDDPVSLIFVRHPNMLFGNPRYAVKMDLDVVLRFMVEELDLEAQLDSYRAIDGYPLMWDSLLNGPFPSEACFLYLLTETSLVHQCNSFESTVEGPNTRVKLIHVASINNDVPFAALSALVNNPDVDVDAVETYGHTALHFVCGNSQKADTAKKIRLLLDAGADPTLTADSGQTAIDMLRNEIVRDSRKAAVLKESLSMLERVGRRIARSRR